MEADYINRLRPAFPHKTEAELELLCSASRNLQRQTGFSAHEHRKRGMQKLFPSRIWHDWRETRIKSVQECLETRTQELMWIGSSNSNKTGDLADIALTLWWTKPEMTSIYVASPFERATEKGVWTEILDQFHEAKTNNPSLPGRIKHSENSIVLYERNPRSFIEVVTVDHIGKLVGKKSKDATQGLMVLLLDELPAFTPTAARALIAVMANLISVQNLLVIGAGNFANIWDALGVFCDPDERDIPNGYEGFDPDQHYRWRTKRGGLALRFDGLQSPNVKAGRDIYPFLTTLAYIAKLAGAPGGLQSADAMRFVRSAPITSLDEFTITNGERIRAGGAYDEFEWTGDSIKLGAFIDPGFGGDACILQKFKLGFQKLPTGRRQIVALWDAPHEIPIRVGLVDGNGVSVPVEDQIVDASKKICEDQHIPPEHVGYDGSMRAGLAQKMVTRWSAKVRPIDSGGSPTDRKVNASEDTRWKDKVDRLLSEFWFVVASAIDSFQVKGLKLSPKAVRQLCTRRWMWSAGKGKGKRRVQTKDEYRETLRAQGAPAESPNEADALVGCVEIARQLGFSLEGVVIHGGSLQLVLEMIKAIEQKKLLAKQSRTVLPSGGLHAMKRSASLPSGKLHR